jgi:hypothetical protein
MFVPGFPNDPAGYCKKVHSFRGPLGFIFPDGWCRFFDASDKLDLESLSVSELDDIIEGLMPPNPRKGRDWAPDEMSDGSISIMTIEKARLAIIQRDAFGRAFDALLDGEDLDDISDLDDEDDDAEA